MPCAGNWAAKREPAGSRRGRHVARRGDLGESVSPRDQHRGRVVPLAPARVEAAPEASQFLQSFLQPFPRPLLIVVALVLLGWIPLRLDLGPARPGSAEGLADRGLPGAFLLGVLFAVTFCPVSRGDFLRQPDATGARLEFGFAADRRLRRSDRLASSRPCAARGTRRQLRGALDERRSTLAGSRSKRHSVGNPRGGGVPHAVRDPEVHLTTGTHHSGPLDMRGGKPQVDTATIVRHFWNYNQTRYPRWNSQESPSVRTM